jgi:hypothetical protein
MTRTHTLAVLLVFLALALVGGTSATAAPGDGGGGCLPAQGCYLPDKPVGFTISATTASSVTIKWLSNNTQDHFGVEQLAPGGSWTEIDAPSATHSWMTYTDSGLTTNDVYCYRVVPYNVEGFAGFASSNECDVVTGSSPAAPSGLVATPVSTSSIALDWTDNAPNERGSVLERRDSGASTWTTISSYGYSGTGARSHSDTGLAEATSYCFRVRAWNRFGQSATPDVCATTKSDPCASIRAELAQLQDERAELQDEFASGNRGVASELLRVNRAIAAKQADLDKCLGILPPLSSTLSGTAVITTSDPRFPGPFTLPVTASLKFTGVDHASVTVSATLPPLSFAVGTSGCTDTMTVTQTNAGVSGTFTRSSGTLTWPSVSLRVTHAVTPALNPVCALIQGAAGPSTLASTATTGSTTSALSGTLTGVTLNASTGAVTLVESAVGSGGLFAGTTVDIVVTGTMAPLP